MEKYRRTQFSVTAFFHILLCVMCQHVNRFKGMFGENRPWFMAHHFTKYVDVAESLSIKDCFYEHISDSFIIHIINLN